MATVPDIIEDLGGSKAIADEIGVPLTTVHSWKRAKFVPSWRVPALVGMSSKLKKPWRTDDFPTERPCAEQAA